MTPEQIIYQAIESNPDQVRANLTKVFNNVAYSVDGMYQQVLDYLRLKGSDGVAQITAALTTSGTAQKGKFGDFLRDAISTVSGLLGGGNNNNNDAAVIAAQQAAAAAETRNTVLYMVGGVLAVVALIVVVTMLKKK